MSSSSHPQPDTPSLASTSVDHLVDRLPCGVFSFSDEGSVIAANRTLATMLGMQVEEIVGRHVEQLFTIAGRIFFQTHLFPLIRLHGHAEEIFMLFRNRDGTDVGALVNAVRADRDGRAITDCVVMEVRERRKYEDALLRARQAADIARAEVEARGRELADANQKLEEQAMELELQHQQLQEQTTELEVQSEELLQLNNELMERGTQLEQARIAADDANRAKSQFLATMSHELRTPLNAIGGYTQLLLLGIHGPVTDAQREALDRVTRSQRHLLRLVNDVLNLARIEAGRVEYHLEDVAVAALVGGVIPMVEPQMQAGGLTCEVSVPDGLDARADLEKLQQIMINLLTNAVKFTPSGGRIIISGRRPNAHEVEVSVRDTGIGIPTDKQRSIFEPFVQVDTSHTRQREGTGLGLAISRDLARGMGGDLRLHSVEGSGSTFTIVLPRA